MKRSTSKIEVKTKCLKCGEPVTETVGRFSKNPEPKCPKCGGKLDMEPLRQLAIKAARDLREALEVRMAKTKREKE